MLSRVVHAHKSRACSQESCMLTRVVPLSFWQLAIVLDHFYAQKKKMLIVGKPPIASLLSDQWKRRVDYFVVNSVSVPAAPPVCRAPVSSLCPAWLSSRGGLMVCVSTYEVSDPGRSDFSCIVAQPTPSALKSVAAIVAVSRCRL